MSRKPYVTIIANGGKLTVARRSASVIYGNLQVEHQRQTTPDIALVSNHSSFFGDWDTRNLTIPQALIEADAKNGYQRGYRINTQIHWDKVISRFDIGYTKCDINTVHKYFGIKNEQYGYYGEFLYPYNQTSYSRIVEQQSKRTSGSVFFTHTFTEENLCGWNPGQDFKVGDVITILIWGRRLQAVVTSITQTVEGKMAGWQIEAGGRIIEDALALRSLNEKIYTAVVQERLANAEKYGRN